jgi:hypothetical protein
MGQPLVADIDQIVVDGRVHGEPVGETKQAIVTDRCQDQPARRDKY